MSDAPDPVPLVILSGFLGAGKTTVLNRVLGAERHRRLAVVVNELGRIDIDGRLLKGRAGDVMELVGGCVCHEVRTQAELFEALGEIVDRSQPERIVLETTGIAEPAAILEGIADLPAERRRVFAAGVVTVVDAEAGLAQLGRHVEARAQVATADRLLLTKLDRAGLEGLPSLHRALAELNAEAERASFPLTAEGTAQLVPWLLEPERAPSARQRQALAAGHKHGRHTPHAHGQLVAFAFTDEAPFVAEPLLELLREMGDALVRAKGFVHVAGEGRRGLVERAGSAVSLSFADEWPPGPRRTELVLIGEGLDAAAIQRRLWACRLPGAPADNAPPDSSATKV